MQISYNLFIFCVLFELIMKVWFLKFVSFLATKTQEDFFFFKQVEKFKEKNAEEKLTLA